MKIPVLKDKTRQKRPIGNIHFGKIILALTLAFTMVFSNFNVAESSGTKIMTVTIGEGAKDVSSLSKLVNIPNLKSVVKVKVNTGIVTHSINGDNVTLNASGGTPSRSINNPTKYSKTVSNSLTSTTNSFALTNPYNDGEYSSSGLAKNGNSVYYGGSKSVSVDYISYSSRYHHYHSGSTVNHKTQIEDYYYSDGIYSGYLKPSGGVQSGSYSQEEWCDKCYDYRSETYTSYSGGRASGTVYASSSFYMQNYSGTAYKAGTDNYYSYTITIEYIDNSDPILIISLPGGNSYFGKEPNNKITISGNLKDSDNGDVLKLYYEINNLANQQIGESIIANGSNQGFNQLITIPDNLSDGTHNLKLWAEDDKGGKSTEISIPFIVDKTGPSLNDLQLLVMSDKEIKLTGNAKDSGIGLHDTPYLFNKDNTNISEYQISNEFLDSNLNINTKYTYKYKAKDKLENESDFSALASKYTLALPPINVSYSNIKQTELTVNWESNSNPSHTKYEIERKLSTSLNFTKVGETTDLKFTNTSLDKGESYTYRVKAINGDGISTDYALGADIITLPESPIVTVIANKNDEPMKTTTVSWNSIKGAIKYAIYVEEDGQRKLLNDNLSELTYVHNNLIPNKKYTYFVQAINENGSSEANQGVNVFTQALSVKGSNGLKVKSTTETTAVFNVVNDSRNTNTPETRIEIKDKSGKIISVSDFNSSIEGRELTGLASGIEYEVWVITRNNDGKVVNDPEMIFNSFYSNRRPELQSITLGEGSHHEGRPLKVNVQSKEFDIVDKIKVMYSITGMLSAQDRQVLRPLNIETFNYIHNSTIAEYEGFIDFTGQEENGIYEIIFWIEDSGGLRSDNMTKTFKISKADYYLDQIDKIAESGTDEELKEALKVILGDEFEELYFPNPLPEHMTEKEYLDIIREQIKGMTKPITKEAVRKMIALVNINCRLSFSRQDTIPKKEITIVLDKESYRYKDNNLIHYQNELKRMYGIDGNPIMRLDEIDVLNAIKLVNFNKKPVDTITIEDIVDLVGNNPKANESYINEYKEAIKKLREENENPTLDDIKNTIEVVNINKKIEDGTLTIEDLKKLLPEVTIYPEYFSEYLKYLRMYKEDLGRNLNVEDIKKVIESVNEVKKYEKSSTDVNRDKALEKINSLVDGSVKKELTKRITPLEKPEIDTSQYQNSNKNSINSFLDNPSSAMLIDLNGQKTIVSNSSVIDLKVINIKGASYIRNITQENSQEQYSEWKPINGNDYSRKLVYKDQGTYLAGVQIKNNLDAHSATEDINIVVDWTAPKGNIVKKNPSQTVAKGSSISIKVVAEDNLKMPMYIKVNGTWEELTSGFFEYYLEPGEGEKLIEIELSDVAGNKTFLYEKIWKID